MRQFDNYNSYLDNLGLPLVGRLIFCDSQGTECNVADDKGNVLGSTVFTTSSGRLSKQVFLYNHDYIVKFEKYVGNTSMNDDVEDESWEPQYSCTNLYGIVDINVDTVGIQGVKSIEDLRRLNPESVEADYGSRIVSLLGYNKVGDKPTVSYAWDSSCVLDDNDGSIIQYSGVSGAGRWVVVDDLKYVDVRLFGAFPTETPIVSMSQRMAVQKAYTYAHSLGKDLYFHADNDGTYYDISGLNLYDVSTSHLARLYCIDGATSSVRLSGDAYFYSDTGVRGTINVYGTTLKASFNTTGEGSIALIPSECFIFDYDYPTTVAYENLDIVLDSNLTKGLSFKDCRFVGNGRFTSGSNSFVNCNIRESMFGTGYNYLEYCTFTNCKTTRGDWTTDAKYEDFVKDNGEETATNDLNVYGNLYVKKYTTLYENVTVTKGLDIKCTSGFGMTVRGKSTFKEQADFENGLTGSGYVVLNSLEVKKPIIHNYLVEEHIINVNSQAAEEAIDTAWFVDDEVHVTYKPSSDGVTVFVPDVSAVGKVLKMSATRQSASDSLDLKVRICFNSIRGTTSRSYCYAFVERGYATLKTNDIGWYIDRFA